MSPQPANTNPLLPPGSVMPELAYESVSQPPQHASVEAARAEASRDYTIPPVSQWTQDFRIPCRGEKVQVSLTIDESTLMRSVPGLNGPLYFFRVMVGQSPVWVKYAGQNADGSIAWEVAPSVAGQP